MKTYKHWCANVKSLEHAIELVQRDLRINISKQLESNVHSYTKILSYSVTCWCEARLMKLLYEPVFTYTKGSSKFTKPASFSSTEINTILTANTLEDKWVTALKTALCKAYSVPLNNKFPQNVTFTARARYLELESLIHNDLLQSIQLRNRIAHGQWEYAFTNSLDKVSPDLTHKLKSENIVALQHKYNIFKALAQLIHDLSSSPATFERDFDDNFNIIERNKRSLDSINFAKYADQLIDRYNRGKTKRTAQKTIAATIQ